MKNWYRWIGIIGAAWLVGIIFHKESGDSRTYFQLIIVPFLALGACLISVRGLKLPLFVPLLFVLGSFGGFLWSERPVFRNIDIGVARLNSDTDDHETRILIAHLEFPWVRHIFESMPTGADARKFIRQEKKLNMLVSGDKNFLFLTFSPGTVDTEILENKYEVVVGAPQIGLSFQPLDGTTSFIKYMSQGFNPNARIVNREKLLQAAAVESPWRSFSHRALPLFLAATHVILTDPQNYEIAEQWLTRANGYLRPNDNAVLRGAVLNNLAVVRVLQNKDLEEIEQTFKRAADTVYEKDELSDDNRAWKCASRNLKKLKRAPI